MFQQGRNLRETRLEDQTRLERMSKMDFAGQILNEFRSRFSAREHFKQQLKIGNSIFNIRMVEFNKLCSDVEIVYTIGDLSVNLCENKSLVFSSNFLSKNTELVRQHICAYESRNF